MTSFWEEQPSPAFYAGAPFHDIPMSEACPGSLEAAVRTWREQKKAPELQQFRGFSLWQRVKDSNCWDGVKCCFGDYQKPSIFNGFRVSL